LAVKRTLPRKVGQRHTCLFLLALELKKAGVPSERAYPAFCYWHATALPVIGTKDKAFSWHEFRKAWNNCRPASGLGAKRAAAQQVRALFPGDDPRQTATDTAALRIEAACFLLFGLVPFGLARSEAAKLCGGPESLARRALEQLVKRGVFAVKVTGRRGDPAKSFGRTTVYRLTAAPIKVDDAAA
jgi:hypothetical protein